MQDDDLIGVRQFVGKDLPPANFRKPVGHILKSRLPDGPKATPPAVKKGHTLPNKRAMAMAAQEEARVTAKREGLAQEREISEKVAQVKGRERGRKKKQPQPPKLKYVKLKVHAG